MRPYFDKKYANVEQKLKLRGEISEIARELGLDGDPKEYYSYYYHGRKAAEEAQEKYLRDQEKGKLALFYLRAGKELSINMDMKMIESGLQRNTVGSKVVEYARIYGIIDEPYRKNCMDLNDEQLLAAQNAVHEGWRRLCEMAKNNPQPFPPYYPVWLFVDHTDEYRKKDSGLFTGA